MDQFDDAHGVHPFDLLSVSIANNTGKILEKLDVRPRLTRWPSINVDIKPANDQQLQSAYTVFDTDV